MQRQKQPKRRRRKKRASLSILWDWMIGQSPALDASRGRRKWNCILYTGTLTGISLIFCLRLGGHKGKLFFLLLLLVLLGIKTQSLRGTTWLRPQKRGKGRERKVVGEKEEEKLCMRLGLR